MHHHSLAMTSHQPQQGSQRSWNSCSTWISSPPQWLSEMCIWLEIRRLWVWSRQQHSFIEIDLEMFSTILLILSFLLIQEGQLSGNVRFGKLTALDMTLMGWLGCKTSKKINNKSTWIKWQVVHLSIYNRSLNTHGILENICYKLY